MPKLPGMQLRKAVQSGGFAGGLALFALLSGASLAETRIPNTYAYYSASADPITDVNTGYVAIDELYDQEADTRIVVRCADDGKQAVWSYIRGKNDIVAYEGENSLFPEVILRLGTDQPITVGEASQYTVLSSKDEGRTDSLGFSSTITKSMVAGLLANKKLVIRITRATGGKPFTYTFPSAGFAAAWQKVNQCR